MTAEEIEEGTPITSRTGTFIVKGQMPEPKVGGVYQLLAEEVHDPKWGLQYKVINMSTHITLDNNDKDGQRRFLNTIFNDNQVESMYKALENPYQSFLKGKLEDLVQISGCGMVTAPKWLARFKKNLDMARIFVELSDYNLTNNMVKKLKDKYKSADLVIQKVKENPYTLVEVEGIGWKTCDEIALRGGMDVFSIQRVQAYILYYLEQIAQNGYSYVPVDYDTELALGIQCKGRNAVNLMDELINALGEDLPDEIIIESINSLSKEVWWSDNHDRIGMIKYYQLEKKIAEELIRIRNGENTFEFSEWQNIVSNKEDKQGWKYTEQQREGIEAVLVNQVTMITGFPGTGKSTIVDAMLSVFKGHSFAQCALSGRAASRMSEITHQEGYTIHRLLGFPKGDENHSKYLYNEEKQLLEEIIIVDELSMVDGWLFYNLIRAIPTGSKLIMLGDVGQLESIGCLNIAADLIASKEISSVELTQIHRQAADSAIITESRKIRENQQIVVKDWTGVETRGVLQDLTIDCYSDSSNTFYRLLQYFSEKLEIAKNIMDVQVIVPIKERDAGTWSLNEAMQELYNPLHEGDKQLTVFYDKGHVGYLRAGDKVINVKNNYKTKLYNGEWEDSIDIKESNSPFDKNIDYDEPEVEDEENDTENVVPVFNGSIGIIKKINHFTGELVIDFDGLGEVLIPKDSVKSIMLAYAITVHKCVTGDTLIYTDRGIKRIDEVCELIKRQEISIYNGNELETPSKFYDNGTTLCKTITTVRGYSLTGTYDHRVDVLSKTGYIECKELKDVREDDYLIVNKNNNIFGNNTTVPEEWLDIKKLNVRTRKFNIPTQITEDFALFLGCMVADGTVHKYGINYGKNQKEVVEVFRNLVKKVFGYHKDRIRHINPSGRDGGMHLYEVTSRQIGAFCKNIEGIQPHQKYIPNIIMEAPKNIQAAFLKGLFEDGTVNIRNEKFDHIGFTSYGTELCRQVQVILLNFGIISTYKPINTYSNNSYLYIYKRDAVIFEQEIGFISNEKRRHLSMAKSIVPKSSDRYCIPYVTKILRRLNEQYNPILLNSEKAAIKNSSITLTMFGRIMEALNKKGAFNDKDYLYLNDILECTYIDRVANTQFAEEITYCVEMPLTHRFIQNGLRSWNCQGSEYPYIIIGIDFSAYSLLSKELLYTALTRAKLHCDLIAQNSALRYAISQNGVSTKQTHLVELLDEIAHPKVVF